jgi:hypothetical protein
MLDCSCTNSTPVPDSYTQHGTSLKKFRDRPEFLKFHKAPALLPFLPPAILA